MPEELLVREVLDLPAEVPECVVNIRQFDDPDVLAENVRDYVITPRVAQELEDFVRRLHRSVEWHEGGRGHFVHGSFGSGKSHFMATLGLILENHPAIWQKDHSAIQQIHAEFGGWLAGHPVLAIPVYMLPYQSFREAMYKAANERLQRLSKPACEFSDARKVIQRFQAEAEKFGDVVYQRFFEESRIRSQKAFERKLRGDQEQLDELAAEILTWRGELAEAEKRHLYPDSFVDGMLKLTRHAQDLGYAAVIFFVDELILYLSSKSGREWIQDLNDLGSIIDPAHRADQAVPLWVVVAKQRNIQETVPEDNSQKHIFDHLDWQKDRFPRTTELADVELIPITQERVLKRRPGQEQVLEQAVEDAVAALDSQVRQTLMHDFDLEDFRRVYPFHPALIRTLIDVSNRLSKERAGIRLLYELLIERYPDLPIGRFVPYAALFDLIFLEEGLVGGAANPELEAVRRTYYDRIQPVIQEIYPDVAPSADRDGSGAARPLTPAGKLEAVVKTVLLCQLSRTMRDQITVERILHLNYTDLRGVTDLGTYKQIGDMLKRLANRADVVVFAENQADPAKSTVTISVEAAPDIRAILKKVTATDRSRLDAFARLMQRPELLGRTIRDGELQGYDRLWRGTRRAGKVAFANVRDLSTAQMTVTGEYTIFIDYPWDQPGHGPEEDEAAIQRGRQARGARPVGFWLPAYLSDEDLKDLEEYAKILELEGNLDLYLGDLGRSAREAVESKVPGFKQAKEKVLLARLETCYLQNGKVLFLDPSITVILDAKTVREGLDRIADAALDRLYPHHPRFKGEVDQRSLRRLLLEFLVPASQPGGSVKRSVDLDDLLERLGEPLEMASQGATAWALARTSKYLRKLEDLTPDDQVKADDVREGLQRAFGFNRDLCDLLILYLAKGLGYRVLRNGKPVDPAQVDFGRLAGVTLERGQVLQLPEWTRAKEIARTWGVQAPVPDLSVGAQDQLWALLNTQAAVVAQRLEQIEIRLQALLKKVGARPEDSRRWHALQAAKALNSLAAPRGPDSYAGLKALLDWKPEEGIELKEVTEAISGRDDLHRDLHDLPDETVNLVMKIAQSEDARAERLCERLRDLLCASEITKELSTGVRAWRRDASGLIEDRALGRDDETAKPDDTGDGGGIGEEPGDYHLQGVVLKMGGKRVDVEARDVGEALLQILQKVETLKLDDVIEVLVQLRVKRK